MNEKLGELVKKLRGMAKEAIPIDYSSRGLGHKFLKQDNWASGIDDAADELETIVNEQPAVYSKEVEKDLTDNYDGHNSKPTASNPGWKPGQRLVSPQNRIYKVIESRKSGTFGVQAWDDSWGETFIANVDDCVPWPRVGDWVRCDCHRRGIEDAPHTFKVQDIDSEQAEDSSGWYHNFADLEPASPPEQPEKGVARWNGLKEKWESSQSEPQEFTGPRWAHRPPKDLETEVGYAWLRDCDLRAAIEILQWDMRKLTEDLKCPK